MPIKFRCPHCRQFLGVSRSKAGALADCPSCGRAIRIPQLDGKVEKVSTPQLNLNHTGLRQALDSLAQLAGAKAEVPDVETYSDEHAAMAVPRPEAEPSFPLVASEPKPIEVDFQSFESRVESLTHSRAVHFEIDPQSSPALETQNGKSAAVPIEVAEPKQTVHKASLLTPSLAALAQLAEAPGVVAPQVVRPSAAAIAPSPAPVEQTTRPAVEQRPATAPARRSKSPVVLMSLISFLAGGGLGAWLMQTFSRNDGTTSSLAPEQSTAESSHAEAELSPQLPSGPVGLTGRVNYIDQDGQSRPDAGSRVLILPADREGTTLLPAEGFRSAADATDRRIAEAALSAMGGAFVVVNEAGEYSATLPEAAQFHVLILSQHMANDIQGSHAADLLQDYVDRPTALLGRVAWTVATIRHKGDGSQPFDHTFVPQGQ